MNADVESCKSNSVLYDSRFRRLLENKRVPAYSIAVLKGGKIVYRLAEGTTSSKNTRFNVGSVSKLVTGAALVQLVEEGKLCIDDPVALHIPEYPLKQVALLHLLNHTAGYDTSVVESFGFPSRQAEVRKYLSRIYEINELKYQLGERSEYFTLGYCILMDVIERVSGMPFESFVRKRLFLPAGMNDSSFDPASLADRPFVLPWDAGRGDYLREEAMTAVMGDRGLFTTADDLLKFGRLFLSDGDTGKGDRVLSGGDSGEREPILSDGDNSGSKAVAPLFSKAAIDFMRRSIPGITPTKTPVFWRKGEADGYGCFGDLNSEEAIGHTGFTGCMLLIDPARDTVAALLTNSLEWHADWRNYRLLCNLVMALPHPGEERREADEDRPR
ncbi:serine hydrolase domain-containing protein [Cohnella herbarum]|uniref:Beta-lactamase family protein n=1 Tax=Cohnella herbarum TaxID=2728023 RepID=A0A7Z2VNH1_9BACL|nr:serine hydrolase domain-containing protein [Cohnella herbarum]QJD86576.1 beta-lactamase family protein [Cohnella herbarum]